MKELIGKIKPKSSNLPRRITVNEVDIFDKRKIANEFNAFFTNIGKFKYFYISVFACVCVSVFASVRVSVSLCVHVYVVCGFYCVCICFVLFDSVLVKRQG